MKILIYDSGKGLLSIVREIIKQKKNNSYFLYEDKDYFPFGNKTKEELRSHLENLLPMFFKNYDKVIIACNTMSLIYDSYFPKCEKVILISDYNFANVTKCDSIIATPLSTKLIRKDCHKVSSNLASYIENNDIANIIKIVKKMRFKGKKVILGCTHYPLIKEVFSSYHKNIEFVSYEATLVSKLTSVGKMSFLSNNQLEKFYIEK